MRSRYLTGWRVTLLIAATASLFLTLSPVFAQAPTLIDERPQNPGEVSDEGSPQRDVRFSRANYVWPYATGPYYGDVDPKSRRERGVLVTPVGSFRLDSHLSQIPGELKGKNKLAQKGVGYFIVQMDPQSLESGAFLDVRRAIESRGGAIMYPMPVAAYLARLTPGGYADVERNSNVIAIEPYHAAFKLSPLIGRIPLKDPEQALSEIYDLDLRIFPGENVQAVAAEAARLGGDVAGTYPDTVRVKIHRSRLAELAAIDAVYRIFENTPTTPMGEETTAVVQQGKLRGGPGTAAVPFHDAGVDGGGGGIASGPQILMILDTGIQIDAADLSNTSTSSGFDMAQPTHVVPGHRKVISYKTTDAFGTAGAILGDLDGCDEAVKGAFTHGHFVASVALGAASRVDGSYGAPFFLKDDSGTPWRVDGVAPGAKLVAYDGQVTPAATACSDPLLNTVKPGDLYSAPSSGSMYEAHETYGATVYNFSWGRDALEYGSFAMDIDAFLEDFPDSMVFLPIGNRGQDTDNDTVSDLGTMSSPATAKNSLAIGVTRGVDDLSGNDPFQTANAMAALSASGPAPGNRVAPQLMAPGSDLGQTGIVSEFACLSSTNGQSPMVECDRRSGQTGSSFSSAAAAGAALLVRDYFAQGFYPDGRSDNTGNASDLVPDVSGALVKSVLIASAQFMGVQFTGRIPGTQDDNLTFKYRFNNEQGYGRIQLDQALPLSNWPLGATGLVIADGGIAGGKKDLGTPATGDDGGDGLDGTVNAATGETDAATFEVCDPSQELRVALSWIDTVGENLDNDLDLEVVPPSGTVTYYGNYFTDDNNRNNVLDTGEDCASIDGTTGTISASAWSLPACVNAVRDSENPTEAVMLSPEAAPGVSQIETGTWTVRVIAKSGGSNTAQPYAVAIAGGTRSGSIALDAQTYVCNAAATLTVAECDASTETDISNRTVVQVLDGTTVVDEETGINFTAGPPFVSDSITLTDATLPETGNGVLDVRSGNTIKAIYTPASGEPRITTASVNCETQINFGLAVVGQFGTNTAVDVDGGCERNARGLFEFGYPDPHMDADENLAVQVAFVSTEQGTLQDADLDLHCVIADGDSPADCDPNVGTCGDPRRENNPSCDQRPGGGNGPDIKYMTITNTPQRLGVLPAGEPIQTNYLVQMASFTGTPEVELVLSVRANTSGKTVTGLGINRRTLNVDEEAYWYSTDFPKGGTEFFEWTGGDSLNGGDEEVHGHQGQGTPPPLCTGGPGDVDADGHQQCLDATEPVTYFGPDIYFDYRFESTTYSDLTAGDTKNIALAANAPWNFDTNDGFFESGITATSDEATINPDPAQWGEDKNFNGIDDKRCVNDPRIGCLRDSGCPTTPDPGTCPFTDTDNSDGDLTRCPCQSVEQRDPRDGNLDKAWGTAGGCGWVTKAPGTCAPGLPGQFCYDDDDCFGINPCNFGTAPATGGVWHTGRIGDPSITLCLADGNTLGQCQSMEVVGGATGQRLWSELLVTPVIEKVNPGFEVRMGEWAWNTEINFGDTNASNTWEVDLDIDELEPVDLFSDDTFTNTIGGPDGFGAVQGGQNPFITRGFGQFADLCQARNAAGNCLGTCAPPDAGSCVLNADCPTSMNCVKVPGDSRNGTVGRNRVGKNSCYFEDGEGGPGIQAQWLDALGLPRPLDDDLDNDGDGFTDELITPAGPDRNRNLNDVNGPDGRVTTLEDFQGGSPGNRFRAAIGITNFEKASPSNPDPVVSFGIAVDDPVFTWQEINLVEDQTECTGSGECAVVDVSVSTLFEGRGVLDITVLDKSPAADNDCDLDGTPDGTTNCDAATGDIRRDVVVRVVANSEPSGEIVILNQTRAGSGVFKGQLPLSTTTNVAGVLFLSQVGATVVVGTNELQQPITVTYIDYDEFGVACENAIVAESRGRVQAAATVTFGTGVVSIIDPVITDNGDGDGFPDTNETVTMGLRLQNTSSSPVTNLTARLTTNDPKIDCIIVSQISAGTLAPGEVAVTSEGFQFHVAASANRADDACGSPPCSPLDPFTSEFTIVLNSDQFEGRSAPLVLDLDLTPNLPDPAPPIVDFVESFETPSPTMTDPLNGTTFEGDNIDEGKGGGDWTMGGPSDGYRCQYNDPDWVNSSTYGDNEASFCFLGVNPAHADRLWWQVNGPTDVDGGRSFVGTHSLYMGDYGDGPDTWTSPAGNLEGVKSRDPINLAVAGDDGSAPELSFKHQVDMLDGRAINASTNLRSSSRAVVYAQLADDSGNPVGDWIKLEPFQNGYDEQNENNFIACNFDPIDDGNDEDDFFDPDDPLRSLGPSTTCFPEFTWGYLGDTQQVYSANLVGNADGPGLEGATGLGTWVESKFSLFRFRGRRIRLRFLTSNMDFNGAETWEAAGLSPQDARDNGWWIDDVQVKNTVPGGAVPIVNDDEPNTGLAGCGTTCDGVNAALTSSPLTSPSPGQVVTLDATGTSLVNDRCLNGLVQYRFWADGNGDGVGGSTLDTLLRPFSDNPTLVQAPTVDTTYVVDARCSSDTTCADSTSYFLDVLCPTNLELPYIIDTIKFTSATLIEWGGSENYDMATGLLSTLSSSYTTRQAVLRNQGPASSFDTTGDTPTAGDGFWYLFRTTGAVYYGGGLCNDPTISWDNVDRDTALQ